MPRSARVAPGQMLYHVFNRANGRLRLFRKEADYLTFHEVLKQAHERVPLRILGWCLMGSHWHFVAWPRKDGELSKFFGYVGLTHAARWQSAHDAVGMGHVYQSRFKNFMIQRDEHLLSVLGYVEGNPVRSKAAARAEDWRWSSLHARLNREPISELLTDWPIDRPRNWSQQVNRPQTPGELEAIATSLRRGSPYGDAAWIKNMSARHGLESTLRPRGRQPGWRKYPERS